jgi:hypothetical protein
MLAGHSRGSGGTWLCLTTNAGKMTSFEATVARPADGGIGPGFPGMYQAPATIDSEA